MIPQGWLLLFVIAGTATALGPTSHQTSEESLRSALDAVTRKQRSLDTNSQEYYNNLHSFKYHGGGPERKFERERQGEREIDEEDDEIEFLPNENGQLETVGNGFQNLNNKLLERAIIGYLENAPEKVEEQPVPSLFRERERSSSLKRDSNNERVNIDNKQLAKLFLEEMQDDSPYGPRDMDDEEYLDTLQARYDRYGPGRGNKLYDTEGPMSWSELFNKESQVRGQKRESEENDFADNDQDQMVLYFSPADRRNVNGRYPIGREFGNYRSLVKRYPVAKRSPKPLPTKKQITDPKVAQDLGAIFGMQTENLNHTHEHNHDHDHNHDRDLNHDHDHDNNNDHDRDHDHTHEHNHKHSEQSNCENTSEAPKVTPLPKGQKENETKVGKSKIIEVKKKSVDWSQYFGIDRRKKKATFVGGQGTQGQDDEWMLQRYYENMAENFKPTEYERETADRKEKLEQMNTKLKSIKNLIKEDLIQEALRYPDPEDSVDLQKVKNRLLMQTAAAYPAEKMRKVLNDLVMKAARMEAMKEVDMRNQSSNSHLTKTSNRIADKRSGSIDDIEGSDETQSCPELEAIEKWCRYAGNMAGDGSQMLQLPCVMLQICKACVLDGAGDACVVGYAIESDMICGAQEATEGQKGRDACDNTALFLLQLKPPSASSAQCRLHGNESCLRRYYRYRHRYLRSPYANRRYNVGYELTGAQ